MFPNKIKLLWLYYKKEQVNKTKESNNIVLLLQWDFCEATYMTYIKVLTNTKLTKSTKNYPDRLISS